MFLCKCDKGIKFVVSTKRRVLGWATEKNLLQIRTLSFISTRVQTILNLPCLYKNKKSYNTYLATHQHFWLQ